MMKLKIAKGVKLHPTFKTLLTVYNMYANDKNARDKNNLHYANTLQAIGKAIAFSVLKKVIDPTSKNALKAGEQSDNGCNRMFTDLKIDIMQAKAYFNIASENIGDGYDLVNVAICSLLKNTKEYKENNGGMIDVEKTFLKRVINRKVHIKEVDSENLYKIVETSIILETFKDVRRYIDDSRKKQVSQNGYSYITVDNNSLREYTNEEYDNEFDEIYVRLNKYADIGGYECTSGVYTQDTKSVLDINEMVSKMELTARQNDVLSLRLRGYGYKAIATYFCVTPHAVAKTVKQIQKKYEKTICVKGKK